MLGQVKLRGMGQRNIAMTSFIAPQVGPSMAPAFLFATDQAAPTPAMPPGPAAPAPAPAVPAVPATPAVETTPAIPLVSIGKQIAGPVIVVALVAALVAWKA